MFAIFKASCVGEFGLASNLRKLLECYLRHLGKTSPDLNIFQLEPPQLTCLLHDVNAEMTEVFDENAASSVLEKDSKHTDTVWTWFLSDKERQLVKYLEEK